MLRHTLSYQRADASINYQDMQVSTTAQALKAKLAARGLTAADHSLNTYPLENEHLINGAVVHDALVN